MFKNLFRKNPKVTKVSTMYDSAVQDELMYSKLKAEERLNPINCDIVYETTIRCGLGVHYKSYDVVVELNTVDSDPVMTTCEICGGKVRLYNAEQVMGDAIMRMALDTLHNDLKDPKGHSVYPGVKLIKGDRLDFAKNVAPLIYKRKKRVDPKLL